MTVESSWWLAALGRTLVWARLDLSDSGVASVYDCDGNTLAYDSEDTARAALMDAEFVALDGLDEDDADRLGLDLDRLLPPQGEDGEALRAAMIQTLPARQ